MLNQTVPHMDLPINQRLRCVMSRVVSRDIALVPGDESKLLTDLGFDSMSLIALLCELEQEFQLDVESMLSCLHARCTVESLCRLCATFVS